MSTKSKTAWVLALSAGLVSCELVSCEMTEDPKYHAVLNEITTHTHTTRACVLFDASFAAENTESTPETTSDEEPLTSVDMGLSVCWADANVGATSPEAYGLYFAWGETEMKDSYDWDNYVWMANGAGSEDKITAYRQDKDKLTTLRPAHDAATQIMGSAWRTPTKAEWAELMDHNRCQWQWTANYQGSGVAGYTVRSIKTGNHIFLPAGGFCYNSDFGFESIMGRYWASQLCDHETDGYAASAKLDPEGQSMSYDVRKNGLSVRAVCVNR